MLKSYYVAPVLFHMSIKVEQGRRIVVVDIILSDYELCTVQQRCCCCRGGGTD